MNEYQALDIALDYLNEGILDKFKKKENKSQYKEVSIDQIEDEELKKQTKQVLQIAKNVSKEFGKSNKDEIKKQVKKWLLNEDDETTEKEINEFIKYEINFNKVEVIDQKYVLPNKYVRLYLSLDISQDGGWAIESLILHKFIPTLKESLKSKLSRVSEVSSGEENYEINIILE